MRFLLGIDIGTSSIKAGLWNSTDGVLLGVEAQEYPLHSTPDGRVEQQPEAYWQATIQAVRRVVQRWPVSIDAIGLSGQMHGTVLLDSQRQPVMPAIIWADGRSARQVDDLKRRYPNIVAQTGTAPAAGFMIATLAWLHEHRPEILARVHGIMLPKDYVRLCLTDTLGTDLTDASSTGLFDLHTGTWAWPILEAMRVTAAKMPVIAHPTQVIGQVSPSAAAALGIQAGIPVVAGCADQPAQAVGNGIIRAGMASLTIGTGGQVFMPLTATNTPQTDPRIHVFQHAVGGQLYGLGAMLSAGLSLRWLRGLVGLNAVPDAYRLLGEEALEKPAGADGLLFLPYLTGERTPWMDARASGGFVGLRLHHGRGHLARAVIEGVCMAMKQVYEVCAGLNPATIEMLIASGGALDAAVWRRILTDVMGLPMHKSLMTEQACVGAALIAGVGVGVYRDFEAACGQIRYGEVSEPNPANQQVYKARYEQFCQLYPLLRPQMHALAESV
jgi:xylulokinase